MHSFKEWFEVTGNNNWLVRFPGMRYIHQYIFPNHPDYNGGCY